MNTESTPKPFSEYETVFETARALLAGEVLQTADVSACTQLVIDWREVKCGDPLELTDKDAFTAARLFVAIVGHDAANALLERREEEG